MSKVKGAIDYTPRLTNNNLNNNPADNNNR